MTILQVILLIVLMIGIVKFLNSLGDEKMTEIFMMGSYTEVNIHKLKPLSFFKFTNYKDAPVFIFNNTVDNEIVTFTSLIDSSCYNKGQIYTSSFHEDFIVYEVKAKIEIYC